MSDFLIYGLFDPKTQELRYVGKSHVGLRRPRMHFWPSNVKRRRYVYNWIRGLMEKGLRPEIRVLEEFPSADGLYEAEQRLIAHYRAAGCPLTNLADGGPGWTGPKPLSVRQKISATLKGRTAPPRTAEHRRHLSESQIGKVMTESARAKMAKAKGGRAFVDQDGRRFETIQEAARQLALDPRGICSVLKGRRKRTEGCSFSYVSEPAQAD